jgi:hypothetical protein
MPELRTPNCSGTTTRCVNWGAPGKLLRSLRRENGRVLVSQERLNRLALPPKDALERVAQRVADLESQLATCLSNDSRKQAAEEVLEEVPEEPQEQQEEEEEERGAWDFPSGPWPLGALIGNCILYVDEKGRTQVCEFPS